MRNIFIKQIFLISVILMTISSSLFAQDHSKFAQQDKKDKEMLIEMGKKLNCNIRTLKKEDVLKNQVYFDNLYKKRDEKNLDLYGHKVNIVKYVTVLNYNQISKVRIPSIIFKIKSDSKEIVFESHLYMYYENEMICKIPKMKEKILLIGNKRADCSANADLDVLSLEDKDFLSIIGRNQCCSDIDNDGYDELYNYASIWYLNILKYNPPKIPIISTIKNDKIVDDIENNTQFYKKRLESLNNDLKNSPKTYDKQKPNSLVLSCALEKFLIYKILGEKEKGWKEFEKDIRYYDDKVIYCVGEYHDYSKKMRYKGEIPIEYIEEKIQKQLKDEEDKEKIEEIGKKFNCDIDRVKFADIQKNKDYFNELYEFYSKETVDAYGIKLELSIYHSKYKMFDAASIIKIKSSSNEVNIPIEYYLIKNIRYKIPNLKQQKAILIGNYNTGTGWNVSGYYIVLLEKDNFLKVLDDILGCHDINKDGYDELCSMQAMWEGGLGYLCHARAPGIVIFYKIENGKIVDDSLSYMNYYNENLDRINSEIKQFSSKYDFQSEGCLLTLILSKFLIYKTINKMDEGWKEFDKDIKHFDKEYYYFKDVEIKKIPIQEIKDAMKDSLAGY